MKKLSFLLVTVLAVSSAALAQTKPTSKKVTKVHCAVMSKHTVDIATATKNNLFADHKGRRYFFCCGGCKPEFKANPAKFAKAESIPTPKAAPKKPA